MYHEKQDDNDPIQTILEAVEAIRQENNKNNMFSWLQMILSLLLGWILGQISLQIILHLLSK